MSVINILTIPIIKRYPLLTFGWNIIFILVRVKIVIGATIRYLIKHKVNYCNKKSLDKLELKYGNIDREKLLN